MKKTNAIKTKTISFTEEYSDVYDYLIKQANASRYVCELIRADMRGDNKLKENIKTVIEEVLREKQLDKQK